MGHHEDVFHPHPLIHMQSYYLKGDHVGGSAEVVIVNTKLLSEAEQKDWTPAEISKKISARLNAAKPADWESHKAVMYFSDMAPYLIRVGCMFEGVGCRYRIDVEKLIGLIKDLF